MKKFISIAVLIAILTISIIPVTAVAETINYVVVSKDRAPIRAEPYEEGAVVAWFARNTYLETSATIINLRLNKWYEVEYGGQSCYIYSGNVTKHTHAYQTIHFNRETFEFCTCGKIERTAGGPKISMAVATAAIPFVRYVSSPSYYALAGATALADGPLPVGDTIALGMMIVGACVQGHIMMPTVETLVDLISDSEFTEYLRNRDNNICTPYSFRKVQRLNGTLHYIDEYCMDEIEALIYVRAIKGDVYTSSEDAALMLVAKYGAGVCERDKDNETYFYHYHLTHANSEKRYGGHIFYGANDFGQTPS